MDILWVRSQFPFSITSFSSDPYMSSPNPSPQSRPQLTHPVPSLKGAKRKKQRKPPSKGMQMLLRICILTTGLLVGGWVLYFMAGKIFSGPSDSKLPYPSTELSEAQKVELKKLAKTVAEQLSGGNKDQLQRHVVWENVEHRLKSRMNLTGVLAQNMKDEVRNQWRGDVPGLFRQILGSERDRLSASFIRIRQRDNIPCALIRTTPSDNRVQYFDLLVVPVKDKLMITDIWDCNRGMFASDFLIREMLRTMPTNDDSSYPWKAIYGENRTKQEILEVKNLLAMDLLNRPHALGAIAALPPDLAQSREAYSMSVHAYQKLITGIIGADQLEKCKALFAAPPRDVESKSLVTGAFLAEVEEKLGNKSAIIPALKRAYEEVGGDPYLYVLMGQAALKAGDIAGAEGYLSDAIREDKNLPGANTLRAMIDLKRNAPK